MMNTFLKKLLIFLAPGLFIIFFFEIYLRNTDTLYKEKIRGLESYADSVELLIMGNSHACYGINPAQFDSPTFNLAQSNQSLYFDKRLILKYLDKLPQLKFVLISLDFHSLYFSSQGIRDVWSFYGHGIPYKKSIGPPTKVSYIFGYTPKAAFTFLKKDLLMNRNNEYSHPMDIEDNVHGYLPKDRGWVYFEGTDESTFENSGCANRAAAFNNTVRNSRERSENLIDLNDFINQLKGRNIIPVLVTSPVYQTFSSMLDKSVSRQNKIDIDSLCRVRQIPYWDFSADGRFEREDFFNCDHLNKKGANKFSKELNFRLQSLRDGRDGI